MTSAAERSWDMGSTDKQDVKMLILMKRPCNWHALYILTVTEVIIQPAIVPAAII